MKKNVSILLLTAVILSLSSFSTDTNLNTISNSTEETAENKIAEHLKAIIEKEGIKSYKVTYPKRKKRTSYTSFECRFPGNNLIVFKGNYGDIAFNLDQLIRYKIYKKDDKDYPIKRLELLF
jgi:hypothetical protein